VSSRTKDMLFSSQTSKALPLQ